MNNDLLDELEVYWKKFQKLDIEECNLYEEDLIVFSYGTTPFETFKKVIEQVKRPKRFVVFGSSIGWQCFFWNSLFPEIPTVGYEIHETRFEYSCYLAEKYNLQNVYLFNEDIFYSEIQDGDLIWQNNLCIDIDLCDQLNWKILNYFDDIQLVSYCPVLLDKQGLNGELFLFNKLGQIKCSTKKTLSLPTSWSDTQNFYIIQ